MVETLLTVLLWSVITILSVTLGGVILAFFPSTIAEQYWALRYIIGLYILGLIAMITGVFGELNVPFLLTIVIVLVLLLHTHLADYVQQAVQDLKKIWQSFIKMSWGKKAVWALLFSLVLAQGLAHLAIPSDPSTVSIFLPTAREILSTGSLVYGIEGETYFVFMRPWQQTWVTVGVAFGSASFGAIVQFSILIACLSILYSWVRKTFTDQAALISIIGISIGYLIISMPSEIVTSTYFLLELLAILMLISYRKAKHQEMLIYSAFFIAFAFTLNYNALFTILCLVLAVAGFWIHDIIRKKNYDKKLFQQFFIVLAVFISLITFMHNKLDITEGYPLLVSSRIDIVEHVTQIHVTTLTSLPAVTPMLQPILQLILYPAALFINVHNITDLNQLIAVNIIILLCLGIVGMYWMRKQLRTIIWQLLLYILAYGLFWTFLTNRYIRFTDMIDITLLLISVTSLVYISRRWVKYGIVMIICLFIVTRYPVVTVAGDAFEKMYPLQKISAATGIISERDYLSQSADCAYETALYIKDNHLTGIIIDNWYTHYDRLYQHYTRQEQFYPLPANVEKGQLQSILQENDMRYLMVRGPAKQYYANHTSSDVQQYYIDRISQEEELIQSGKLVFNFEDCQLYSLE